MELRRLSIWMAFFLLAHVSQSSEARHSVHRRESDYSDEMLGDDSNDYGAQNDADGGNDADNEDNGINGTLLSKPDTYRLLIGKNVRLECRVEPVVGPAVSWVKGKEETLSINSFLTSPRKNKYALAPGSWDLIIKDLSIEDTGEYTCKLFQNDKPNVTHTLIVEEPPMITNPEESTTTFDLDDSVPRIMKFSVSNNTPMEGSDVMLTCNVTGTPTPDIIWSRLRKGDGNTEGLTGRSPHDTTLYLRNVTEDDSGTYYCYALSNAGNATAMLNIHVYGKPRVHVHRPVINTDIGVAAVLQCSTHDRTHQITWSKDDQPIEETNENFKISTNEDTSGSHSTLTVVPSTDDDFGTFTCEAKNSFGISHSKSIELVQRPVVERLQADGLKLTWTVHSHQPLEDVEVHLRQFGEDGKWLTYKVPLPETKAHEYELIYVLNDEKLTNGTYEATVKVKNNKAWSRHSDPAVVDLASVAQPIQTASVLFNPNSAFAIRPSSFVLNAIMMYLLVRML